ncbi:putative 4'-phosphopantetheinyl transferase [Fulvimarina pelagi HTCC2506]|uniref:Putative 4'-phosphopantetheinyl transferase n=1 Tax=Fulvimarina pelagi HTCC2506 TaxID=314231 RepID=Q0G4X8_9HYPH|nr:putative 4'-phosphopantetheinyl transferase [Fulvimarina pelagi HTCC2506]
MHLVPIENLPADRLAAYPSLLDAGEAARHERFRVNSAREEFLVGRALLRTRLSALRPDIAPEDWRFALNAYGRPAIDWSAMATAPAPLFFNLSHTRGLVALVVGGMEDIGVDVETIARGAPERDVARRFFTEGEADWIDAGTGEIDRTERFFALWTLKEAYIKARGMGLSLPLDGFFFDCSLNPPSISFTGAIEDEPSRWRFERRWIDDGHRLALAVPAGSPPSRFFETEPLGAAPRAIAPNVADAVL